MLLEVARCRADSDSEEAPAVRQRAWRATLSAARVTPSKILLPKTRPPAPATAGARPAFQDDSARKPSEPRLSARERSPETSPRAEDPREEEAFFSSPQSSVGGAAAALAGLAEQLKRVKRAGTSRARSGTGTRQSPRFKRSGDASPPPAPPPSPARSLLTRVAAAGEARVSSAALTSADENAPVSFSSPRPTPSPRTPIRILRRAHENGVATSAPTPASRNGVATSAHEKNASVRRRLDAPRSRSGKKKTRREFSAPSAPSAPSLSAPSARGVSGKRKRLSVETAAFAARAATTFPKRGDVDSSSEKEKEPSAKTTRKTRGAYDDDELKSLRETNPVAYNRVMGNRRSAANSKKRREALLEGLRTEIARLRTENAALLARK
jgi:hypothetical protein